MHDQIHFPGRATARPTFESVYATGLPFLRQSLRWLGIADHDLDDVLQDVMLAAYRGLDGFDPERAARRGSDAEREPADPLEGADPAPWVPAQPSPADALRRWLFGIAWRQASHYRDRAHRRREVPVGAGPTWPYQTPDPRPSSEQIVAIEQRSRLINRLLAMIAIERRVVIIMYDLLDIPIADIAAELDLKENTVRSRLRAAREELRVAIKRMRAEERRALHASGLLAVSERRGPDEIALVRAAREIPPVPEEVRRRIWGELQRAIASCAPAGDQPASIFA